METNFTNFRVQIIHTWSQTTMYTVQQNRQPTLPKLLRHYLYPTATMRTEISQIISIINSKGIFWFHIIQIKTMTTQLLYRLSNWFPSSVKSLRKAEVRIKMLPYLLLHPISGFPCHTSAFLPREIFAACRLRFHFLGTAYRCCKAPRQ
jgi:hypothetical protein